MNSNYHINTPILLIAFNRPDTTNQVFQKIREAKPTKLYVAVDGSRPDKVGEDKLVDQVTHIVNNVDWPCQTHYKYNETNMGAEVTVSSAIHWVFETEEYAIILEDDIIAPLSFFRFAQEMLEKYKNEDSVAIVTGSNFTPMPLPNGTDYFFAKYGHSWGWATWRRAWAGFDLNVSIPNRHLEMDFLRTITNSKAEAKYYQKLFRKLQTNGPGNSTWDYIALYRHRVNDKLSVIPRVNLTSNIGVYGLHARGQTEHHFRPFDENFKVTKHPAKVECYDEYDQHHFKTYINKRMSLSVRIINKFIRMLRQYIKNT